MLNKFLIVLKYWTIVCIIIIVIAREKWLYPAPLLRNINIKFYQVKKLLKKKIKNKIKFFSNTNYLEKERWKAYENINYNNKRNLIVY